MKKNILFIVIAILLCCYFEIKGQGENGNENFLKEVIATTKFAPPGMYIKDHYLIQKDVLWHLFAPLGPIGTMWHTEGSEESAEHMISKDMVHWKHIGTAVSASRKEGHFDRIMGGIAPCVVRHEGKYYMFYSGWDFKSKNPKNFEGFRQRVGMAISDNLMDWEKPEAYAKNGLEVNGWDPMVVWDEENDRWLLFTARPYAVAVYTGQDLFNWEEVGLTLNESDLEIGMTGMNPGESPFVMKHPLSNKWIIFLNGGYSISDDPLNFPPIIPYPFESGIYTFAEPHDEGKGTYYYTKGVGFAHEIIEFKGQWYMTGAVGTDGHTKLKFTPIEWTEEAFRLSK
jgi:hypothetical protein